MPSNSALVIKRYPKKFGKLSKKEKDDLLNPLYNINFKTANREDIITYSYLLNKKVVALRDISRLGKDISEIDLNFDAVMVYETLCDFTNLLDAYVSVKDDLLYNNYAKDYINCCPQCHADGCYKYLCVDCLETNNRSIDKFNIEISKVQNKTV